jgi:hypothetical protein
VDLVGDGRPIAEAAKALGNERPIDLRWRRQDRIHNALTPGLTTPSATS